jgi:hypothetical protein
MATTAPPIKIIQGDSFSADISRATGGVFSNTWSAKWVIARTLGATPISSGEITLIETLDIIPLRIYSADTENIPPGRYVLVVQVSDSATMFQKEVIQQPIVITAQGIPGA